MSAISCASMPSTSFILFCLLLDLIALCRKFEELAVGVLEECHHADATMTQRMLHMKSELFGMKDCIEVSLTSSLSVSFLVSFPHYLCST